MKKLALIVCVLMLISIVACTDKGDVGNTDTGGTNNTTGTAGTDEKTLTGKAQGYGGEVTVTIKVKGTDIVSVEAVGAKETEGIGSKAIAELPDKIEDADSTKVDGVSGATVTSNAIKEAVDSAMASNK